MIFVLLIFGFLFYLPSLWYGFVNDDLAAANDPRIVNNKFKRIWWEFNGLKYWNKKRAHLITIILHLTTCFLIYKVFGSLLASLLFLINPINYQGGIWLGAKAYSKAAIVALLVFKMPILYLALLPFVSIALWGMPFIFLQTPTTLWALLPFLGLFLYWKTMVAHKWDKPGAMNDEMRTFSFNKFIPYFKTFGYYTVLALVPYQLGMYHSFIYGVGVDEIYSKNSFKIDKFFFGGLALFIFICSLIFLNWGNPVGIGLMWWIVCISQWCNFVTCQQHIAERFVYVANIGLMVALATIISPYSYIITALVVYYITRNLSYRKAYIDDARLLENNIFEIDDAHYAWLLRGVKAFKGREFWSAYRYLFSANFLSPHDFKVNFNLAQVKIFLKQYDGVDDLLVLLRKHRLSCIDEEQLDKIKTMMERSKSGEKIAISEIVLCM